MKKYAFKITVLILMFLYVFPSFILFDAKAANEYTRFSYGRDILSSLNNADSLLYVYDRIAKGIMDCDENIDFPQADMRINTDEIELVFEAVYADYPDAFHVSNEYGYSHDGRKILSFSPKYSIGKDAYPDAKKQIDEVIDEMTVDLFGKSDYEKALVLHDRLAKRTSYVSGKYNQSAYGAIVDRQAVCAGYTKAYQLLLSTVGIKSWYVSGVGIPPSSENSEAHAWNILEIEGDLVYTDVTWDDQGSEDSEIFHAFFNASEDYFTQYHIKSNDGIYQYMTLEAKTEKHSFFYNNDSFFSEFDSERVKRLLIDGNLIAPCFVKGDIKEFTEAFKSNASEILYSICKPGEISYMIYTLGNEVRFCVKGELKDISTTLTPTTVIQTTVTPTTTETPTTATPTTETPTTETPTTDSPTVEIPVTTDSPEVSNSSSEGTTVSPFSETDTPTEENPPQTSSHETSNPNPSETKTEESNTPKEPTAESEKDNSSSFHEKEDISSLSPESESGSITVSRESGDSTDSNKKGNSVLIILIGITAVAGAGACFIIIKRKKQ